MGAGESADKGNFDLTDGIAQRFFRTLSRLRKIPKYCREEGKEKSFCG